MIKQIELCNYKSYDNMSAELKPITLLCGGNSSGKTAILKSILLMKQSFEASGNNYLLINGRYTNNGVFSNIRRNSNTHEDSSEMGISMTFVVSNTDPSFRDFCRSIGMFKKQSCYQKFEIHANFCFSENQAIPQVGEIVSSTISVLAFYSDTAPFFAGETVDSTIRMTRSSDDQHYTIELQNFPFPLFSKSKYEYPFEYLDQSWDDCTCYFRGMQLVSLYKDLLSKKSQSALPVIYTIFRILASEFDKVEYIGPLRESPLRQYFLQDVYSGIGVKGENTAHYLGQFGEQTIEASLPGRANIAPIKLKQAVAEWANFLGIEELKVITTDIPGTKVTQIMIGEQNIVDVGFGVSQVLPILVEGLTIEDGATLILEQPEIHLHPKMQMDIADFLVMIALQGKNLVIETHSDHIINRIVRRALEDDGLRDMIRIFYVEKTPDGNSNLSEVRIHESLGIDEAPEGFFDQYASETEKIIQAGYHNMRVKRGGHA